MFKSLNILEVNAMSQLPSQALPPTNQSEAKPHQSHHPLPHLTFPSMFGAGVGQR